MPPTSQLIARSFTNAIRKPFVCSSCRQKQASSRFNSYQRAQKYGRTLQYRSASTVPSVIAVNAKHEIPPRFRDLYSSLKKLEQDAGIYVNTSQLQLALRGLESESVVTRVGVLGVNGHTGARRLVRTLLADPLAAEESWEKRLAGTEDNDERAILLRYGDTLGFDDRHPLIRSFSIPSSLLHKHKLEILIHSISAITAPTDQGATSLLVPSLDIANSSSGRPATVTYPVHKALVYQEGLSNLGTLATLDPCNGQRSRDRMFKGVIDWSWSTTQQRDTESRLVSPINLALAEAAIETFRSSLNKSMEYEHLWFDAGMPDVSAWLIGQTETESEALKPAIRRLLETICDNASRGIIQEETLSLQQEKAAEIPVSTKNIINQGISIWAEGAHTELRDRLNGVFHSQSWKKTKWWKLFWRVDDVGYITSEILQRAWLVEAEKGMIWLTGRIHQSGLLGQPRMRPSRESRSDEGEQKLGSAPPVPSASDLMPQILNFQEPTPKEQPWPQDISRARSALASLTVPPLQALSQALLIQTISTNIFASSLSALIYVSVSTTSPYESLAIAATGLVFSLRRLQKRWETARSEWVTQIREEGRRVLKRVESLAREAVEESKPAVDEIGMRDRAAAMEAVGKVREALNDMNR